MTWSVKHFPVLFVLDEKFTSYNQTLAALTEGRYRYALIDSYVAESLSVEIWKKGFQFGSTIGNSVQFGMKAYGEFIKIKECVNRFTTDRVDFTQTAVENLKRQKVRILHQINAKSY